MATASSITLTTERLTLRQWRDDDGPAFAAINADPAVMEHFPAPMSTAESDAMIDTMRRRWVEDGFCFAAVELTSTGECIGLAGLAVPRFDTPFMPAVEIGWRIARHHWGHGYAPEAAYAWLDHGFCALGLEEIVSFTVPANASSRRVMTKIGLRHDPDGDFEHPSLPPGDPLRHHVLYRLGREEWTGAGSG